MPDEIAVPFRLDSGGGIAVESNPNAQIRQHVMSLINTEPSERAVLGDYGVALEEQLFTNDDNESVAQHLADQISAAFAQWEPGVRLQNVTAIPGSLGDGTATVDVQYLRVDAPDTTVSGTGTNVAVIRVGGHVDEVVRG